jgi:hypothetical protein
MNRKLIRLLIVLAVVVEALWALQPRKPGYPRSPETVQAEQTYKASPSAETEATYLDQIRRDISHNARDWQIMVGFMLLVDAVAIYFFWNYGVTKPAA